MYVSKLVLTYLYANIVPFDLNDVIGSQRLHKRTFLNQRQNFDA